MIPGDEPSSGSPYLQECKQGIVNDFNCSTAVVPKVYAVRMGIGTVHDIKFNVLGARPIFLSLEVVWVDHYPVELDLSLSSDTALNDSISHVSLSSNSSLCSIG